MVGVLIFAVCTAFTWAEAARQIENRAIKESAIFFIKAIINIRIY
jgi:hypothetical protein